MTDQLASMSSTEPGDTEALPAGAKFPLGRVIITPSAAAWVPATVIERSLARHQSGDWGDVSEAFAGEMDEALRHGQMVISTYFRSGPSYQIVTYADRLLTRVSSAHDPYT
jgi:hypothetical protein